MMDTFYNSCGSIPRSRRHLGEQVAADFLLAILERRGFAAEVQTAMAAFALIGHELTSDLLAPRQLPYAPLELRAPHDFSVGHFCPLVNGSFPGLHPQRGW